MKPSLLKSTITYLLLLPITLSILSAGCDKVDDNSDDIIGLWEWLCTEGGVVGRIYPDDDESFTTEFTKDSVIIKKENGVTTLKTDFHILGDTLWYTNSEELRYLPRFQGDTLELVDLTYNSLFSHYFKKIH